MGLKRLNFGASPFLIPFSHCCYRSFNSMKSFPALGSRSPFFYSIFLLKLRDISVGRNTVYNFIFFLLRLVCVDFLLVLVVKSRKTFNLYFINYFIYVYFTYGLQTNSKYLRLPGIYLKST